MKTDLPVPNRIASVRVPRCETNPLIDYRSSASLGDNINGPSVIRTPSWIKNPLGKYYLYFAHHKGTHIRLAYADHLSDPWKVHEPGTLRIDQAQSFREHIASPDVHVDDAKREIRMYFHGVVPQSGQRTGVATSTDGITFAASDAVLGSYYFRVFRWKDAHYAIAKHGNTGWGELLRSSDGVTPFESRGEFIRHMRHAAVLIRKNQLLVFYSRVGDAPERIVAATVELTDNWRDWRASEPVDVIAPETDYEGMVYPNNASRHGPATKVRQLRDPCLFTEDGRTYLFYSIAGEMGIAMAEIEITMKPETKREFAS